MEMAKVVFLVGQGCGHRPWGWGGVCWRPVWLEQLSRGRGGSWRWAAGWAPRADGGLEPRTGWSKKAKHLQSLHTGERVFGEGDLGFHYNLINTCLNTYML